ncbi:MAG: tripartite tricarboxylate transporter TctB family protein [Burkholderiales bacterium]
MAEKQASRGAEQAGISTRTMDIVVAVLIFALGAIVVFDSYRLGSKWGSDGPQSGYFPFYVGLLICISSLVTVVQALRTTSGEGGLFVAWGPLRLVLTVLIPAAVYVLGVQYVGLYIASAIYILIFMVVLGKYSWLRSIAVGVLVNVGFFLMFEVWFKVPLFKGDLDPLRFLGY